MFYTSAEIYLYVFISIYNFSCFLFFRCQGFRMITFDCQAGPFQNFSRSQVMVIGRSVSFSARPPILFVRFRTPGTFLTTQICREKNFYTIFFSVNKNFQGSTELIHIAYICFMAPQTFKNRFPTKAIVSTICKI